MHVYTYFCAERVELGFLGKDIFDRKFISVDSLYLDYFYVQRTDRFSGAIRTLKTDGDLL